MCRQTDSLAASVQRLFPVDDLEDRRLRPIVSAATVEVREQLVSNKRRAKSVTIIYENALIPEGAPISLELETLVRQDAVQAVNQWLNQDTQRSAITWFPDPTRPLRWAIEPNVTWTPSALRNEIFERAGVHSHSFSAADAWCYNGTSLYWLANSVGGEA